MGRELQKKKNRSSIAKVRRKPKSKKRILSNHIIAANWDKTKTLSQNYRRLGLASRLNKNTGGVEKTAADVEREAEEEAAGKTYHPRVANGLLIGEGKRGGTQELDVEEAVVERDAKTGKILRVIESNKAIPNPLQDPLNHLDSDSESSHDVTHDQHGNPKSLNGRTGATPKTDVVEKLQSEADRPFVKYKFKQSEGERVFVEELVAKYGDDYEKMARDTKINYMQRSAGDLKRRVKKWKESRGEVD